MDSTVSADDSEVRECLASLVCLLGELNPCIRKNRLELALRPVPEPLAKLFELETVATGSAEEVVIRLRAGRTAEFLMPALRTTILLRGVHSDSPADPRSAAGNAGVSTTDAGSRTSACGENLALNAGDGSAKSGCGTLSQALRVQADRRDGAASRAIAESDSRAAGVRDAGCT